MPNPIKGSDIFQDDGALDSAIRKVERFIEVNEKLIATVQQNATSQARAIRETNSAQSRNIETQAQAAREADKLARAYQRYEFSLSDAGREMARLKEQQRRQNTLLRNQARAAASAENSYDRLAAQYNLNKLRLNAMSREQREAAEASSQLVTRTRQLFEEMKRLQAETGKTALNVGNYADAIKDAFGEGIGLGAGALGPAAIGAGLAAGLAEGTRAAIELSEEIRNVRGELSNLVSAGDDLDGTTTRVRALSKTFDEDAGEIIRSVNSISKQFDIGFSEALDKLEQGFIAGANLNEELLDSTQEYSSRLAEVGLSANDLLVTIRNGADLGVFSDKAIDSVAEAGTRLREMTTATQEAIEGIGLSTTSVANLIENEGMGPAIAAIAERLGNLRAESPEVGRAIADIFGGPGEAAGLVFLRTLKDLGTETGSLIDVNNEYQQQQARLLEINQDLADAQSDLVEALGGAGLTMQEVTTQGQTLLTRALIPIIESAKSMFGAFSPVVESLERLGEAFGGASREGTKLETVVRAITSVTDLFLKPIKLAADGIASIANGFAFTVEKGQELLEFIGLVNERQDQTANRGTDFEFNLFGPKQQDDLLEGTTGIKALTEEENKLFDLRQQTTRAAKEEGDANEEAGEKAVAAAGSMAALRSQLSELKKELDQSAPEQARGLIPRILQTEEEIRLLEALQQRVQNLANFNPSDPLGSFRAAGGVSPLRDAGTIDARVQGDIPNREITLPQAEEDAPQDLFDLLGFNIDDTKKQAITSAFDFAKQQLLEFFALRAQLAQQRSQEATEEVRQAEAALQAEISREEQGLASRVDLRERELRQAQAAQRKALDEQRKAERAQRRIQTIQQAANLVTASTKIFAQLGFPAALPAIALMFGTFAATKIQAARAARRNLRQGKYEVMNYGTAHGFGGDIPLGFDNKGRENFAERGEGLMVVPAARASQYKGVLPSMFKAIQAGKLHRWIGAMSDQQKGAINVMTGQAMDTSKMEGSLERIAGNTDKQVWTDGNGNTVVREGNVTTTYRA